MIAFSEYLERIEKLKKKCKTESVDAFLVCQEDNLYYLTGKSCFPFERPFVLVIWPDRQPTFLIPRLELEHLSVIEHIDDFRTYYEYPTLPEKSWQLELSKLLKGCEAIGTDQYTRSEIFEEVMKSGNTKVYNWVYEMRFIKSIDEQKMLRKLGKIAEKSMADFLEHISFGDLALESLEPAKKAFKAVCIERKFEVDFYDSEFISVAWPAPMSAKPHMIPSVLSTYEEGPHVMILSYRLDGYAVELERTFFTQIPSKLQVQRYMGMMKAREKALSMCKPGVSCSAIDKVVRAYLTESGYEQNVIHRIGHGMGVSNHEGPFVSEGSTTILKEGMVITIEPGIYFEDMGGFRHSDTVLITSEGYEILTDFTCNIDDLTCIQKRSIKKKLKRWVMNRVLK